MHPLEICCLLAILFARAAYSAKFEQEVILRRFMDGSISPFRIHKLVTTEECLIKEVLIGENQTVQPGDIVFKVAAGESVKDLTVPAVARIRKFQVKKVQAKPGSALKRGVCLLEAVELEAVELESKL